MKNFFKTLSKKLSKKLKIIIGSVSIATILVAIVTPIAILGSKKNKKPGNDNKHDNANKEPNNNINNNREKVKTSLNLRPGNTIFQFYESLLSDWGLDKKDIFTNETQRDNITNVELQYQNYDFDKKGVNALLIFYEDGKRKTKNIFVTGFADPKIAVLDQDKITEWEFKNIELPPNFVIPDTVTEIDDHGFWGAKNVPNIPPTVTTLKGGVFQYVILPDDWKNPQAWNQKIGYWAYQDATLPAGFIIPESVNEIGYNAFERTIFSPNSSIPRQVDIIKMAGTTKTMPTIKQNSYFKTAGDANENDFNLPTADGLSFKIINVTKSTTTTDGTTVTVSIEVSSDNDNDGTTARIYTLEVSGFNIIEVTSSLNLRPGNTIFKEDETSLSEWGLDKNDIFPNENQRDSITNITLKYQNYDFDKKGVKALLTFEESGNQKTKNIFVTGFADPKIAVLDQDKITEWEFKNIELPPNFVIPDTVTEIDDHGFWGAKNVPNIPPTVTTLKGGAFQHVTLPDNWQNPQAWNQKIGDWAYQDATLPAGFIIPESVNKIGYNAFERTIFSPNSSIPRQVDIIKMAGTTHTPPTIKANSQNKTAIDVDKDDFELPTADGLSFKITNVEKSTTNTDGTTTTVTIEVSSADEHDSTTDKTYTVEVSGFKSDSDYQKDKTWAQNKINTMVTTTQTPPAIKAGSESKTATNVDKNDLTLPTADGLSFKITKVEKSTTTTDGTTATVTIEVSSANENDGTIARSYTMEVSGFKSETNYQNDRKSRSFAEASSNITNGKDGQIFEDSQGNIWAMGNGTGLQVKYKGENDFVNAPGSNISDGQGGFIFEDSNGNIWAIGGTTPLQVKYSNQDRFQEISSKISFGWTAKILEDSQKNIWIIGWDKNTNINYIQVKYNGYDSFENVSANSLYGHKPEIIEDSQGNIWFILDDYAGKNKLQVKYRNQDRFQDAPSWKSFPKNKDAGEHGYSKIFEDSQGNIWSLSPLGPLQVKYKDATDFVEVPGSNITNGKDGQIFEDSQGNIWAVGNKTGLQVKYKDRLNFVDAPGSNITDGQGAKIFEDSNNNIWSMGFNTSLQVKYKDATNFVDAPKSNINNGGFGTIFEDSQGNIWAMGNGTGLQVKYKGETDFVDVPGSNITDGMGGVIFEDSDGNIWAMGRLTPLQVLK